MAAQRLIERFDAVVNQRGHLAYNIRRLSRLEGRAAPA